MSRRTFRRQADRTDVLGVVDGFAEAQQGDVVVVGVDVEVAVSDDVGDHPHLGGGVGGGGHVVVAKDYADLGPLQAGGTRK